MGLSYNPLNAPGYIAGTITISGGQIGVPQSLLSLIRAQLEANCPGTALMVQIMADAANAAAVFVGASSNIGGALSATNYGYALTGGGSSYKTSAGAGNSAPIADIQVFCAAAAILHVEIYS